ncbi:mechanosensitive ion channel family protein [Spirochaetota bacterium]
MKDIYKFIKTITGLSPEVQYKIISSIIIILFIWILKKIIIKIFNNRKKNSKIQYRFKKTAGYFAATITILILGRVWFKGFSDITTFLGLFSAGLAIALKEMVLNIAGWGFLIWRKPFELGDRIQIGNLAGDVIDIRIFQFTILEIGNWVDGDQSTGRIIHVPNGKVFSDSLANYSKGLQYIWNEIHVLLTFESNWEKAKKYLLAIANKHSEDLSSSTKKKSKKTAEKYFIFYSTFEPTVYTSVKESGVQLSIRYQCEPKKRRDSEQKIWEQILHKFAKHNDIDFAYPTQRFYDNTTENKSNKKGKK